MAQLDLHPDLHDTIGYIYDSALDPARWPAALQAMCAMVDAFQGSISVLDSTNRNIRFATEWTEDPEWPYWRRLLDEKYGAMMPFYPVMSKYEVSELYNTQMLAERGGIVDVYDLPFFKEWALPSGRRDTIGSVVVKTPTRFGVFALHTSTKRDLVSSKELEVASCFITHVHRAVTIGDLLTSRTAEAQTLAAVLDKVGAAVFVTDANAQIIHANARGENMLRAGAPVASVGGQLTSHRAESTAALRQTISRSAGPVHQLGNEGIGVPLRDAEGEPAIAHVMPLVTKAIIPGLERRAVAAVFVAPSAFVPPAADTLMALFGLTRTEVRVLLEIAKGQRRADAAAALGIADSTAKTHLDRVYSKTGARDQASLSRLVASLSPPMASGG